MIEQLLRGMDFTGYIAVEFLVSYLLRGKQDPLEIIEEKDRQACLLGILILANHRGDWMTLGERIKISPAVTQEISDSGWLPDQRTYNSWKQYWNPRQFIEILTVPLELYNERDNRALRYDSYTKGYGNGGHVSRVQKTPYNPELDGESTRGRQPEFSLPEIQTYNRLLFLIEREKALRIQAR
jgi:hypothetical protein